MNSKHEIVEKKAPIDYVSAWSRLANRKPLYNRMDPNSDTESDTDNHPETTKHTDIVEALGLAEDKAGEDLLKAQAHKAKAETNRNKKVEMTRDDWREFWVVRLRKHVQAPTLTDTEIANAVDRTKRAYLHRRREDRKIHIVPDPDLPSCYYWDKFQVANWAGRLKLPDYIPIKEILLSSEINGRRLIALNAMNLVKMGIYEWDSVKTITAAVRAILRIPPPNALRPLARLVPLETFLMMKLRTGIQVDKLTFKQFCDNGSIDYESAKLQIKEGYKPIAGSCRVVIRPESKEDVNWFHLPVDTLPLTSSSDDSLLRSSEGSSSFGFLYGIPTVEELVNNAVLRNAFISEIINEIVEKVYEAISTSALKEKQEEEIQSFRQQIATAIFNDHMSKVYSEFSITDPEDRLKFIKMIAEELVGDVLRAREVFEDIDGVQRRIETEISKREMGSLQDAVGLYVQSIMPLIVSSALKHLKQSSHSVHFGMTSRSLTSRNSATSDNDTDYDDYGGYAGSGESANDENQVKVLYKPARF